MMGGDRNPEKAWAATDALAGGIKECARDHRFTAHAAPEFSAVDQYSAGGWLDLNTTYTYRIVHKMLMRDYHRKPVLPFVLIESTYEGEHNASAIQIRRQAYWALLSGAAGQFLGNRPVWLFDPGWEAALDSPGSRELIHLRSLLSSRPWHELLPDREHRIVVSGLGEFNGLDYLAAARTADRRVVMAYLPAARTFSVEMSEIAGPRARAGWFNPRNGTTRSGGVFPAQGRRDFRPPEEGDWVLILEDAGLPARLAR